METFVIDASTSLKWVLDDEDNYLIAQKILEKYLNGKISLVAPDLWIYEIVNGLNSATLTKRITKTKAKKLLNLLLKAKPSLFPMEGKR